MDGNRFFVAGPRRAGAGSAGKTGKDFDHVLEGVFLLGEKMVGAKIFGRLAILLAVVHGVHDDGGLGASLQYTGNEREAVFTFQPDIQDHQIGATLLQCRGAGGAIRGFRHGDSRKGQE